MLDDGIIRKLPFSSSLPINTEKILTSGDFYSVFDHTYLCNVIPTPTSVRCGTYVTFLEISDIYHETYNTKVRPISTVE